MITFDQAIAILGREALPLGMEMTRLAKAGRRILAEPVRARLDAPRYDAAAMDGFAVSGASGSGPYTVIGSSYPGQPYFGQVGVGQAVRIMTGAEVPIGADRVIPIESTDVRGNAVISAGDWPAKRHVRARGSDIRAGEVVMPEGTMLDPRALLIVAAADVSAVKTWRRPVVGVISCGDELVAPGSAADQSLAIPDSLSEAVLLLARQHDAKPGAAFLLKDDVAAIRQAATSMLADCDILVLIGGASRGDRDYSKAALEPLDLKLKFADVAMKPGKPVWYARVGERHILGLPGNPTAALTTARLFLAPLIRALSGRLLESALEWRSLPLTADADAHGLRESFLCGSRTSEGITILDRQSASSQLMLARADLLVRVPSDTPALIRGTTLATLKF